MNARPFREDDAPGRIPESLIDSVLDGTVDERTKREVARALRHDPRRRQDVAETMEAISALRRLGPDECPDLSASVLATLDRRRGFLSARGRRFVKRARFGAVATMLVALVSVAGLQRGLPRLATLGDPPTPVNDVAQAVQSEAVQAADELRQSVRVMQASMPSLSGGLTTPGRAYRLDTGARLDEQASIAGDRLLLITLDGGRLFVMEHVIEHVIDHALELAGRDRGASDGRADRGGVLASMLIAGDLPGTTPAAADASGQADRPSTDADPFRTDLLP